jgi:lysyl endopeptidase
MKPMMLISITAMLVSSISMAQPTKALSKVDSNMSSSSAERDRTELPSSSSATELAPNSARIELPALDLAKLAAEDAGVKAGPYRYAVPIQLSASQAKSVSLDNGNWSIDKNGMAVWRAEVMAKRATSIDVVLSPFRLPHGASLSASSPDGKTNWGPYTDANNNPQETLPLPVVEGDTFVLELVLPAEQQQFARIAIAQVNQGYRGVSFDNGQPVFKAGGCNYDAVCPEGNAYRDQIRAVVRYGVNGGLCTGTLINNTRSDRAPLLLTANHCLNTQTEASAVVAYYNYQSTTCRARTGGNISSPPPGSSLPTQSGSTLLAATSRSDVTLLRMNGAVPGAASAYWNGWDRRDIAPSSAAVIHHPAGDEKRITLENNATRITTSAFTVGTAIALAPGTGIEIFDWDIGTTEQGSSGSALLTQDSKLIVGTLSGGDASCSGTSNAGQDYFGRLFTGWEGSGTSTTRLRDHLDPLGTAPSTLTGLDGASSCTASISLAGSLNAGSDVTYTVTASGGNGSYSYAWDIDGDGVTDRTSTSNTLTTRYDRALSINVTARVTDTASCNTSATRAIDVAAPDLRFDSTQALSGEQICGNGNNVFDPGERWRLKFNVRNFSAQAINANVQTTPLDSPVQLSAADAGGYRFGDSITVPAACGTTYISDTDALTVTAASTNPNITIADQGRTGVITLGNFRFNFYGETINSVAMSTNGYLLLNPVSYSGGDFQPNCTTQPAQDSGKRLRPLHQDLFSQTLRSKGFTICPRPSAVGNVSQPCAVFEWRNVDFPNPNNALLPSGLSNFDMQAVIYPETGQIVYQYRNQLNATQAATGVVGLMNNSGTALNYQCPASGNANITAGKAICFYSGNNVPQGTSAGLVLTKASGSAGNIASGQSAQTSVEVALNSNLQCGQSARLRLLATVDDRSVTTQSQDITVPIGANCQVVNNCAVPASPSLRGGSYFNPARSGNGLVSFIINRPAPGLPIFFGAWFTGEADRDPTWYIVQGDVIGNHVRAPILRVTRNTASTTFSTTNQTVGQAQVSIIANDRILLTYQFDQAGGQGREGGELMQFLLKDTVPNNPNNTGHYFQPTENGWGLTVESFVAGGQASEFILYYIYDAAGQPRWVLAQEPINQPNYPTSLYQAHCPTCAWLDIGATKIQVGTMTRAFPGGFGPATISTNFQFPAPYGGSWLRNNFAIQPLSQAPN